ncbi:hypothetical protein BC936DRAFT_149205 [Jimgerdemannia flammicorona]|uniref:Uncharacterized protein n=1 Tax=Jimgerdemannia flammicorona TaxID=994334 RepID=A0A433D1B1_9FUNG|nr:hypothetical protein BC936DRAFT_149205 [Jimgerdemannia flammicorona]
MGSERQNTDQGAGGNDESTSIAQHRLETDKGNFDRLAAHNLWLENEKEIHTAELNKIRSAIRSSMQACGTQPVAGARDGKSHRRAEKLSKRDKELVARNLLLEVVNESRTAEFNKLWKSNKELKSGARKNQHEINHLLARNHELETELERRKLELDKLAGPKG